MCIILIESQSILKQAEKINDSLYSDGNEIQFEV
jgi:hypothetical protein